MIFFYPKWEIIHVLTQRLILSTIRIIVDQIFFIYTKFVLVLGNLHKILDLSFSFFIPYKNKLTKL